MPFILDGLDSEDYDRTYKDGELLRRIARYFRPFRRQAFIASAMLTLYSASGTAGPILISKALDLVQRDPSTRASRASRGDEPEVEQVAVISTPPAKRPAATSTLTAQRRLA